MSTFCYLEMIALKFSFKDRLRADLHRVCTNSTIYPAVYNEIASTNVI